MLDLSIVVLVWQDRAFLPACLKALAAGHGDLSVQVILVENGITLAETEYAPFTPVIVHNAENRGVAAARNQGLAHARARYLMLLDVDTIVTRDAVPNLVRFMDAHPEAGLAGPRLQDRDGKLQLTCRKLPTLWTKFLRRIPTQWAKEALADEMLAAYDHRTSRVVDYVIGACQIIRREAYVQVGALDERFFYGPEDVDYCIRMWRAGWGVMYVPDAVVIHNEQRLTQRRAFSKLSLLHAQGLARYFWKHRYLFTRPSLAPLNRDGQPTTNQ